MVGTDALRSHLRRIVTYSPVLLVVWMGWQRRWLADDAYINLRVVRQLLAGNGPVFNVGERVEAGTSALWIGVLAVLDLITPFKLEWIAALGGLACTGAGLALATAGTRRLCSLAGSNGFALPLGVLVYAAVPATWDYATSGLENGLSVLWIGSVWAALCVMANDHSAPKARMWQCALIGAGPLVRPDLGWVAICLLIAALTFVPRRWPTLLRHLAAALALPVIFQLFRMGYYGVVVPNTAIAKEASRSHWPQGWHYLSDLVGPYRLVLPLALLLAVFLPGVFRRARADGHRPGAVQTLTLAALGASLGHALFVVRVGGDFMHARMLLPALLLLLLPVAVVRVVDWRWLVAAAVLGWALVCATALRPDYSSARPQGQNPRPVDAIDPSTKIADEREVHRRMSGHAHPVSLSEYEKHMWVRGAAALRKILAERPRSLVLDPYSNGRPTAILPLSPDDPRRGVVRVGALGLYAYSTPLDISVLDRFGLSDPLSSHQRLKNRGRPGHEKDLPAAWVIAEYAVPGAALPNEITLDDVTAARRSLQCGDLLDLRRSTSERLTFGRFLSNTIRALGNTSARYSGDPEVAASELCT